MASWSSGNALVLATVLPTARHRCGIIPKGALLPADGMTRDGTRQLVTHLAYY